MKHEFQHRGVTVNVSRGDDSFYCYSATINSVAITGRASEALGARRSAIKRINRIKDTADASDRKTG